MTPRPLLFAAVCAVLIARPGSAQPPGEGGRLELSAGGGWIGGLTLGSANATETSSAQQAVPIFAATTTIAGAPAAEVRVGWRFTRRLTVEAEASFAHPPLRVALTNDIESAPSATVSEQVEQFLVGGAVRWRLPLAAARLRPFVSGGGGYLRDLHEGATLAQTGRYYRVGGGADVVAAERMRRPGAVGVRIDASALFRVKGAAFDDAAHVSPTVSASLFVRF